MTASSMRQADSVTSSARWKSHSAGWLSRDQELQRPSHWPLRAVRKFTINPVHSDDFFRFPRNEVRCHDSRWYMAVLASFWRQSFRLPYAYQFALALISTLDNTPTWLGSTMVSIRKINGATLIYRSLGNELMIMAFRLMPLLAPMMLSMMIDLYEDYQRYWLSYIINTRQCVVLDGRNPHFHSVSREELRVGQILRLHENEEIPADSLLLCSSNADARAYVSQELISGNDDVVKKVAVKDIRFEISSSAIANVRGQIICNQPSPDINSFCGGLRLSAHPRGATLDSRSFLCQGSILRKTEWIYCLILFTGPDTKMARYQSIVTKYSRIKRVPLELLLTKISAALIALTLLLSLICASMGWTARNEEAEAVYGSDPTAQQLFNPATTQKGVFLLLRYTLLFSEIVSPVFLLMIDIMAFVHARRIERSMRLGVSSDVIEPSISGKGKARAKANLRQSGNSLNCSTLGASEVDQRTTREVVSGFCNSRVRVSRSECVPTLGQVDFILADKTGTLTTGADLTFVFCSVSKRIYGKCFRHKRRKSLMRPAPGSPRVRVKQRQDLKPSLKRPALEIPLLTGESEDAQVQTDPALSTSLEKGDETTKKVFRFDTGLQASPTSAAGTGHEGPHYQSGVLLNRGHLTSESSQMSSSYEDGPMPTSDSDDSKYALTILPRMNKYNAFVSDVHTSGPQSFSLQKNRPRGLRAGASFTEARRNSLSGDDWATEDDANDCSVPAKPVKSVSFGFTDTRRKVPRSPNNVLDALGDDSTRRRSSAMRTFVIPAKQDRLESNSNRAGKADFHLSPRSYTNARAGLRLSLSHQQSGSEEPGFDVTTEAQIESSPRRSSRKGATVGTATRRTSRPSPMISSATRRGSRRDSHLSLSLSRNGRAGMQMEPTSHRRERTSGRPDSSPQRSRTPDSDAADRPDFRLGSPPTARREDCRSHGRPRSDTSDSRSWGASNDVDGYTDMATVDHGQSARCEVERSPRASPRLAPVPPIPDSVGYCDGSSPPDSCEETTERESTMKSAEPRPVDMGRRFHLAHSRIAPRATGDESSAVASNASSSGCLTARRRVTSNFGGPLSRRGSRSSLSGRSRRPRIRGALYKSGSNFRERDMDALPRVQAEKRWNTLRGMRSEDLALVDFDDEQILKDLRRGGIRGALIDDFIKALALCHSVRTDMEVSQNHSALLPQRESFEDYASQMDLFSPRIASSARKRDLHTVSDESSSTDVSEPPGDESEAKMTANFTALTTQAFLQSVKLDSPLAEDPPCVKAAYRLGYGLLTKTKKWIVLEVGGTFLRFERLFTMEYSPARPRALVVLRQEGRNDAKVYCKGGASAIFDLIARSRAEQALAEGTSDDDPDFPRRTQRRYASQRRISEEIYKVTAAHAHKFILKGYRTIGIARRRLSSVDVEILLRRLEGLNGSTPVQREKLSLALADELESGLEIVGVVGLQEELAPGVARTVTALSQAGVRTWILTGDLHERAISTACQAQVLKPNMKVVRIELSRKDPKMLREIMNIHRAFDIEFANKGADGGLACFLMGSDLENFVERLDSRTLLMSILMRCEAVLLCEATPAHKAIIADMLRSILSPSPVVLAIGDGLNDVPMFLASNISVSVGRATPQHEEPQPSTLSGGIRQMERKRARRAKIYNGIYDSRLAADFVIPSFSDLRTLLFQHGRTAKRATSLWLRVAVTAGIMQAVPLLMYSLKSLNTAVQLRSLALVLCLHLFSLGIPLILLTMRDYRFNEHVLWHVPIMYTVCRRQGFVHGRAILLDFMYAVALAVQFACNAQNLMTTGAAVDSDGKTHDSFASLILLETLGLCVGGIGVVIDLTNTIDIWQGWVVASLALLGVSSLLISESNTGWVSSEYTVSDDARFNASDLQASFFTIGLVGMTTFIIAWLLRLIYDAVGSDFTKTAAAIIKQHRSRCLTGFKATHPLCSAQTDAALAKSFWVGSSKIASERPGVTEKTSSHALRDCEPASVMLSMDGDERKILSQSSLRSLRQRKMMEWNEKQIRMAEEVAFALSVKNYLNPQKIRRIVNILPPPRRRYIRACSASGHQALPLPYVTAIDKLTEAAILRRKGAALMEVDGTQRRRSMQQTDQLVLSPHLREDHQPAGKELERLCSANRKKQRGMTNIVDHHRYEGNTVLDMDEDEGTSLGGSSDLESQRDDKTFTTEPQDEVIHVVDLMNMVRLTFKDQQLEADYQVHCRQHIRQYRLSYRLSFLFLCVVTIMEVIQEMFCGVSNVGYGTAAVAFVPYAMSFCLYISSHYDFLFINYFDILLGSFVLAIAFFQLLSDTLLFRDGVPSTAIYSVLIFIFFRIPFLQAVFYNVLHFISFTLRYALTVTLSKARKEDTSFDNQNSASRLNFFPRLLESVSFSKLWTYLPVLLGIEAFTGFAAYRLEYNRRKAFLLDYQVEKTRKKQTEILHTMLPPFVVAQMLNGPLNRNGVPVGLKAEDRGTVSVLFCDVYDFQNIVASVAPTHLVKVLDSLFLCFDKCADRFGCTKIETVFETYLAASGISLEESSALNRFSTPSDNAFDILCMALIMLRFSRYITYVVTETPRPSLVSAASSPRNLSSDGEEDSLRTPPKLNTHSSRGPSSGKIHRTSEARTRRMKKIRVKIGIHSGRVISGVVGAKKPQYALFGDTVNTASRMKTTGKPDHIHISSATYDLVKSDKCLLWEQREIEVKGKGTMTTYLLTRIEVPQAPRPCKSDASFSPPRKHRTAKSTHVEPDEPFSPAEVMRSDSFQLSHSPQAYASFPPPFSTTQLSDHLGEDADSQGEDEGVNVDPLWSRFRQRTSRDNRRPREGGSSPSAPSGMPTQTAPNNLDFSSGRVRSGDQVTNTVLEETAFRACLRRLRMTDTGYSDDEEKAAKWQAKSAKRITSAVQLSSLTFKDRDLEERYKAHYYANPSNINNIEQAIIIFLATYVIQTLVFVAIPRYERLWAFQSTASITWSVRSVITVASFILWLILHFRDRSDVSEIVGIKWVVFLANLTFMVAACAVMLESSWSLDFPEDVKPVWLHVDTLQLFFFITILHHNSGLLVQHVVLVNVVVCCISLAYIKTATQQTDITTEALFLIPLFIVANIFSVFFKEYVERQSFIVNEDMQQMEDRGKELLRDMLPKEVLEELQQEKLKLAYKHDRITFIFADICGFTTWADTVDASEVVTVLQSLFAKFDRDSTRFGVFKVCTIGDAYVAVSEPVTEDSAAAGLYDPANGAERVLAMAQCMIRDIKTVREKLNIPSLNMRIGLHFGSCIGGIIGSGRLRYDLWGIDVLTGNLMESNGVPGRVCMSHQLVDFLDEAFPGRFQFVFHKAVEVTNRIVNAYLLITERHVGETGLHLTPGLESLNSRGYMPAGNSMQRLHGTSSMQRFHRMAGS